MLIFSFSRKIEISNGKLKNSRLKSTESISF